MSQSQKRRNKIVEEAVRRSGVKAPSFSAKDFCFGKQYDFIKSPVRFKAAVCSRRAGKTIGIAADMIDTCLTENDVTCLYVTLTSRSARNIIWPDIKRILEDYKIPAKTDDTRLEVTFNNRSQLKLGGAKDENEIEKYRGWKLRKVYIDEGQSFRPYLKYFIGDILIPALRDLRGQLALTGTPGPVPAGPFFEYANNKEWDHHFWTAFDNPFMHNPPEKDLNVTLAEERRIKGISESDPGYLRETYGQWVEDLDALVFKFNQVHNIYSELPTAKLTYVLGIDIGFHDADAIAVLGYNHEDRNVYLVDEIVKEKQGITPLIEQIQHLQAMYSPVKMVMDTGGLGKKIQEELVRRHALNITPAEKTRKHEFIELLNDDLRTFRFKAFKGSRFAEESTLVQWDKSNPLKLKISDVHHSDITDAVLYGWRECRHYFNQAIPEKPKYGTAEYWKAQEEAWEAEDEKKYGQKKNKAFWDEEIVLGKKEVWEK